MGFGTGFGLGNVSSANIAAGAVTTSKLADGAVTLAKQSFLITAGIAGTQVFSSATPANVTGLAVAVVTGHKYKVDITLCVRTTLSGTSIVHTVTIPAATSFALLSLAPSTATDAINSLWSGRISSSGDVVTPTGASTANVDQIITMTGFLVPSASGTLQVQLASETGTENVSFEAGCIVLTDFGT